MQCYVDIAMIIQASGLFQKTYSHSWSTIFSACSRESLQVNGKKVKKTEQNYFLYTNMAVLSSE